MIYIFLTNTLAQHRHILYMTVMCLEHVMSCPFIVRLQYGFCLFLTIRYPIDLTLYVILLLVDGYFIGNYAIFSFSNISKITENTELQGKL